MKKAGLLLTVCLLHGALIIAQTDQYLQESGYRMQINIDRPISYEAKLMINRQEAIFIYHEVDAKTDQKKGEENLDQFGSQRHNIILRDDFLYKILTDKKENKLFELHKNIGQNSGQYYSWEEIPPIEWMLEEGTKIVNDLELHKATASFRGRKYTTWYAPSLANSYGPWKLHGLPGQIVEAYDDLGEIAFQLTYTKPSDQAVERIVSEEVEIIDRKEHLERVANHNEALSRRIQSAMGRGINVNTQIKVYGIEVGSF